METDFRLEILTKGLDSLGLDISVKQQSQFQTYHESLIRWNRHINLTSPRALRDIERVHFWDSLSLVPILLPELDTNPKLIDIGSGAGFPGIPIKLVLPDIQLTLVEATNKKAEFLKWLVAHLGLRNVNVVAERAEKLAHAKQYRESFDVATARALGRIGTVLELTLPFCSIGGIVAAQRTSNHPEELHDAEFASKNLGGQIRFSETLHGNPERDNALVLLVDKINSTSPEYPRRDGVPSKRPLMAPSHE